MLNTKSIFHTLIALSAILVLGSCEQRDTKTVVQGDAASMAYVAPGEYDEFYCFMSGGYSGQVTVYGLPSGRLFKEIPVFSQYPENGYGYSEETKPMFNTSYGMVPWDDSHHIELSQTDGEFDGRWLFVNGNNTPRIARIDLTTFETVEILEIPDVAGLHCAPFITENSEYLVSGTRFSVPIPQQDVPIDSYKENFVGLINYVKLDQETGEMSLDFQIEMPGYNYDLARNGKGKSHGWSFLTTYNSEQAHTLLEVNASQKDKDLLAIINWKKAAEYMEAGKFTERTTSYYHNTVDHSTGIASSEEMKTTRILNPKDCPDMVYFIPVPKSPHGCDVNPTGEYIVGNGKLSADMTVYSFDKLMKAIENKDFTGDIDGIPVINYESGVHGILKKPGLGPLHTEFDGKGFAYTTFFISSEVVKWNVEKLEIVDRQSTFYSPGHLVIPGGETKKPYGKYLVAMNKITKDRFLPTGPELCHSAQLFDISGDKMKLILDFPTKAEPHYAQAIPASKIQPNSVKYFKIEDNKHPYAALGEAKARVEREGKDVHVYMTAIRSHLAPDNIEGIKMGDKVYFHLTNLEQDWDVPHGFAVQGANNAELLVMPGQTRTLLWEPFKPGVFAFYCTDFCSALHQEMSGYVRVSPADSDVKLMWGLNNENKDEETLREMMK
ncbi:Sec-dependent nitrous-oxide reductase [Cryomorpha ignava]|uniref:Sec-dependent nitrous-oxide reductase n=1 Tax=Cryomorpha ignava TaxID=101383 RepID=A0A7K3WR22_9FLAO|nr:Sec-dependent nitrous-oxide reductase [Cryomorpha ignava]NEN23914.1 Sec-dependent nitrous-oxide reductase [Cryomorpha ignava]